MTNLQSLLTELKRLEREAKETDAWNTLSAYSDLVQNASPVLVECLESVLSSIENDTYLELTELDAICERGMK